MHHLQTLPNGLRLVTVPLHDTKAISLFVLVKVGARYETRSVNGASHFLEHLMFKGTKKRPTALSITKLLDGVGASYNAFTAKDLTGYYIKINAEHTDLAFDVLSDILRNSLFKPSEIDRERGVIVEEIKMYQENPVMGIDDLSEEVLFGTHHPLGWNILGPKKTIEHISRTALLKYKDQHYHAGNIWVVATGRLPDNVAQLTTTYFGGLRRGRPSKFQPYHQAVSPIVRLEHRATEQVQLSLSVRGLPYGHPKLPALSVLTNILGGTMSSRLFVEVREKRGLAYSIGAGVHPYEDTGSVTIQAGTDKAKTAMAIQVMIAEIRRLQKTAVSAPELRRAKEYLRGRTILDLEDSDALAGWYGRQALFGKKILDPNAALKKVAAVTASDVQSLAKSLFRPDRFRLAMIGPFSDPKPWHKILRGR